MSEGHGVVEVCVGCDHAIAKHYADPTGVIRCCAFTVRDGRWGISSWDCDCADYQSQSANEKRTRQKAADDERDVAMRKIVNEIRRREGQATTSGKGE